MKYAALKRTLAALHWNNRDAYSEAKSAFITETLSSIAPSRTQQQFSQFYPASYGTTSQSQMASDALLRLTNSQNALQSSVSMQAQSAQNFSSDQSVLRVS